MSTTNTARIQHMPTISSEPTIGGLSVELFSFIMLGVGFVSPVVFLLVVCSALKCHSRIRNRQYSSSYYYYENGSFRSDTDPYRDQINSISLESKSGRKLSKTHQSVYTTPTSSYSQDPYFTGFRNHVRSDFIETRNGLIPSDRDSNFYLRKADAANFAKNSNIELRHKNRTDFSSKEDTALKRGLPTSESQSTSTTSQLKRSSGTYNLPGLAELRVDSASSNQIDSNKPRNKSMHSSTNNKPATTDKSRNINSTRTNRISRDSGGSEIGDEEEKVLQYFDDIYEIYSF